MLRRALLGAAVVSLALAGPASAANSQVETRDDFFNPSTKTVNISDRVRWTNAASVPGNHDHTSTANSNMPLSWNRNLDQGLISDYVTFPRSGSYAYHCNIHPSSMKGTVLVRMKNTRIDSNSFTIRVAATNAPPGFTHHVQFRKSPSTTWNTWATFPSSTRRFDAPSAGTWQFHARLIKTSTNPDKVSGFSPIMSVVAN